MSRYRRLHTPGTTWFFTVITHERQPLLTHPDTIAALRAAMRAVRGLHPFQIDAVVILPDHLHALWTLPPDDSDYALRWSKIKRSVSQAMRHLIERPQSESSVRRREIGFWQRRFWEHQIRDEDDFARHVDYVHYNPVKHGLVDCVRDWPYSSFHRYVRAGLCPIDWGGVDVVDDVGNHGEPETAES